MATAGPIPLVVAVSGHTDLRPEDIAPLTDAVRRVLADLRARWLHSELVLLTPLAEGADRVAARAAADLGIPLVAALPMPADEYVKDFADAASVREFDELRGGAASAFVVPEGVATRPDSYVRGGAFNVQHCHLLLALWDGATTGKPGGTGDIVRFRLEGVPAAYAGFSRLLDPVETGVVLHIVTPRQSAPVPADACSVRWLMPEGSGAEAEAAFHRLGDDIDEFNSLATAADAGAVAQRQRGEQQLQDGLPALAPELQRIAQLFAIADELAIRFQRRSKRAIKLLFLLAFGGIAAFEAYAHMDLAAAVVPYVLLTLLAYGLYLWVTSRGFDDKHLDYRALAEAWRVQFYWRLSGVAAAPAEYCLRYRLPESEWVRTVLRAADLQRPSAASPAATEAAALPLVVDRWVRAQYDFFTRAEQRDEHHLEQLEWRAKVFARLSFAGVILFVVLSTAELFEVGPELTEGQHHMIVVAIAVLAAAAAMIHGYIEKLALAAQVKRYQRMRRLFQSALRLLDGQRAGGTPADARIVLRELGREALEENADWVMLHRDRPLELPTH
jgi:hypothetical protein